MSVVVYVAYNVVIVVGCVFRLTKQCLPAAEEELGQLQDFASSEGFHDKLQNWDIAYWRHRHSKHLFK